MAGGLYDRIGANYSATRRADSRLAAAIWEAIGDAATVVNVGPIPHDCMDGFYGAFWRRPEAFLDPVVRAGISVFAQLGGDQVERGCSALAADQRNGAWRERHRDLLELEQLHLGYHVVVAELAG